MIIFLGVVAIFWAVMETAEINKARSLEGKFKVGMTAPNFDVKNMKGHEVKLSDYQGKKVIMNFWASWCEPCVREMPIIYDFYQSRDDHIEVLFINVGESKGTINEFLTLHHFDFPVIIDATGTLSKRYRISGLPSTVIINKEGNLDQVITGELSDSALLES